MSARLRSAILAALGLFILWAIATWFLEGRIETLLRPDAVMGRLVYIVVVNLLIGIVGAAFMIRVSVQKAGVNRADTGFGRTAPSPMWIMIGLALGLGLFLAQGAPSLEPVVIINAYAQVFAVSAAEVVVCWALIGGVFKNAFGAFGFSNGSRGARSNWAAAVGAAVVASILFGAYHFGHSAPFNTIGMVAFLSFVGLWTSAFFFISRDVYATVAFHNFLGVLGVVQALAAADKLGNFSTLQVPLLITAAVALLVLIGSDIFIIRRSPSKDMRQAAD